MSITYDDKAVLQTESIGSVTETVGGVAVIVLSIMGLARGGSSFMASVATIVLGAALVAYGGAIAAEYTKLLARTTKGMMGAIELGGGMTIEILAGGAAIVLGILALSGFSPNTLIAAAIIGIGTSLMLGASSLMRLSTLKLQAAGVEDLAQQVAQAFVAGGLGSQVLAGGAAIVLGVLALTVTSNPAILTMVGLLVLGVGITVSGAALTGRLLSLFRLNGGNEAAHRQS